MGYDMRGMTPQDFFNLAGKNAAGDLLYQINKSKNVDEQIETVRQFLQDTIFRAEAWGKIQAIEHAVSMYEEALNDRVWNLEERGLV